jgi:hypothetical protein
MVDLFLSCDLTSRPSCPLYRLAMTAPMTRLFIEYRKELIIEATNAFLEGDIETGKTLLKDYLNATIDLSS